MAATLIIDPRMPLLSQAQAAAATGLSMKAIDNYIQHGFLIPARIERRRMFSVRQVARLQLVEQLSTTWQVPPKSGFAAADALLALPICKSLLGRAVDVPADETWVLATISEEQVHFRRNGEGDLEVARQRDEQEGSHFLALVISPHSFVRWVLWRCCTALAAGEERLATP